MTTLTAPDVTALPTAAALVESLDGPFAALKARWRVNVAASDITRDPAMSMAEARRWTQDALVSLSQRGYVVVASPSEPGGRNLERNAVGNFEMLALGDLSLTIKSGVQHGLLGGAVQNLGNDAQRARWLPGILSLQTPGCFAMTERDHGSDVACIETTITYLPESDEFEVHTPHPGAAKAYIGNAAVYGRLAAVFGQLEVGGERRGVHVILVPIRDADDSPLPGVTTGDQGHKGGLLGVDNGTIRFDHVRVPRANLLDRYGGVDEQGNYTSPIASPNARFFTMLGTLVRGRICVGGGAASATRRALSIAARYALQRRQFRLPGLGEEIPLMDYLTHQRKLLVNIAKAYALGYAQNELSLQLQRVVDAPQVDAVAARELETRAAGMKAIQTRWANDTVQVCREACGGAGYMSENQLTKIRQDVDVFATFEGDNTVLLQLVAKALLLDYRRTWGDLDLRGTAEAAARLIGQAVMERTAARPAIDLLVRTAQRRTGSALRDRGWQVMMFEDRERHSVEALARRLRATAKLPQEQSFAAMNRTQPHMLHAAVAHTERVVLEAFIAGIESTQDAAARRLLERACDLFALSTLEADRAWFLEHNRLTPGQAKAVTAAVDDLCEELRPQTLLLVEGLGVPEGWLQAAMLHE